MSGEATCVGCGTTFRGDALSALAVDTWERRGDVLCELRWCLCQRDRRGRDVFRGGVVSEHPEHGANVVLRHQGYRGGMVPVVILKATPSQWVSERERFNRAGRGAGWPRGGEWDQRIDTDELARLEAWSKAGAR